MTVKRAIYTYMCIYVSINNMVEVKEGKYSHKTFLKHSIKFSLLQQSVLKLNRLTICDFVKRSLIFIRYNL